MRKTNIMLLAALVASPLALADEYGYDKGYGHDKHYSYGKDYKNLDVSLDKTKKVEDSYNEDNDYLIIKDVGNVYKKIEENNKQVDNTYSLDLDEETNYYLAESKLQGTVMGNTVTYGGACCRGHGTTLQVNQDNHLEMAFGGASGINVAGQNVGNNSLVQQNSSTNAALVGTGGGVVNPGGGDY